MNILPITQHARCNLQKGSDRVTALAIQESLEVVVAAGTERGLIYVFQLPSPLPGRCKEVNRRFVVSAMLLLLPPLAVSNSRFELPCAQ